MLATRCDQQVSTRADRIARADELVAEFADCAWQRLSVGAGAHGPLEYDWARRQIEDTSKSGRGHWLLARRSIAKPTEIAPRPGYRHPPLRTAARHLVDRQVRPRTRPSEEP
ncbi:hypothetical protein GLP40_13015 [Nocardia sp. CT2-14]|uniref:Uncharacterized protein n=1 Tax=Nocardia aurantiaca TaxID=2675850 RepID=A0A6I3L1G7_9NOCA|nr:hypothetical protein [Nocardia aurantiaca]MTE13689.1 hypothetical protein [Nocardia aurantiaca]